MTDVQKFGEEFQRVSKDGFDASVRSLGDVNKGLPGYCRGGSRLFEDGIRGRYPCFRTAACCKVVTARFLRDPVWMRRIAYEGYVAEFSKLGEMCAAGLTRNAYKPV